MWDESKVLIELELYLLQVLSRVLVGHVGWANVKFKVRTKILKVVIVGKLYECQKERGGEKKNI